MPDLISLAQQKKLRDRFDDSSMPGVVLAVRALGDYVVDEFLPQCRESIAALDLPDGEAYYAYRLRVMTTTDMTAAEIHRLGVDEVDRIRA